MGIIDPAIKKFTISFLITAITIKNNHLQLTTELRISLINTHVCVYTTVPLVYTSYKHPTLLVFSKFQFSNRLILSNSTVSIFISHCFIRNTD